MGAVVAFGVVALGAVAFGVVAFGVVAFGAGDMGRGILLHGSGVRARCVHSVLRVILFRRVLRVILFRRAHGETLVHRFLAVIFFRFVVLDHMDKILLKKELRGMVQRSLVGGT